MECVSYPRGGGLAGSVLHVIDRNVEYLEGIGFVEVVRVSEAKGFFVLVLEAPRRQVP